MDVGTLNEWRREDVVASAELRDRIHSRYPLEPVHPAYRGEVASRYRYADGAGEVGFISSVSEPFCRDCSRARIAADGTLFTCLFARDGVDLRTLVRSGASDEAIRERVASVWRARDDRYSELRPLAADTQWATPV